MECILGGTFSIIHKGHERMLEAALAFDEIHIGLTSDRYAKERKNYPIIPYAKREENLRKLFSKRSGTSTLKIMKIEDKFGFAPDSDADAIIVSAESENAADEINTLRRKSGKRPLKVISVPLAYGEDLFKISSGAIHGKKIDSEGRRLKPVNLVLGTMNPSKRKGVELAASKVFKSFDLEPLEVSSEVSDQPFEQETVQGAINRAKNAYLATGADYGIGIESGIFRLGDNHQDMAVCAVFDGERTTLGNSMGFQMPPQTIDLLAQHKDLGAVMESLTGMKKIGYKEGAIHYLSGGLLSRTEMNEQAFLCAMIPRISEAKGIFRYR